MTSATDELRRMLDERGVEYEGGERSLRWRDRYGIMMQAFPLANGELGMGVWSCTPAQAIAATLGNEGAGRSNDGVAELEAGTCRRVYLVEVSDDLIESWCPLSVYLHREAAEDCAEALRKEEGGIWQFARVSELKVVDDG